MENKRRQYAFAVDATRCINCKTCEIACQDAHHSNPGVRLRRVRVFEQGEFPALTVNNISMACNHCEDPVCASHCPTQAYSKREDGIVVHNEQRCIGCRYCTWVCPYGAPQFDEVKGCIQKCDLCAAELDRGGEPACVEGCPTRAIAVRRLDEVQDTQDQTMHIRNLPAPEMTRPTTRYRVRDEAKDE